MTVAFIGHREIKSKRALTERLRNIIETLIVRDHADTFLFGGWSGFCSVCHSVVSSLKNKYAHIRRVYVRGEFEYADETYMGLMMLSYENTVYPQKTYNACASSYIKCNEAMIDMCDTAVVYYNEKYKPKLLWRVNGGTKHAVEYAEKHGKPMINIYKDRRKGRDSSLRSE